MSRCVRFSQLSLTRQALVRLCQETNFGQIRGLVVREGEPIFEPRPTVLVEVRLDLDEGCRPEINLDDFVLREEVCRLMERLQHAGNTVVERIEVRSGIPRRVVIESILAGVQV